ncbi:hypothetical protein RFI_40256, partial [Reticulomyxa filosa]
MTKDTGLSLSVQLVVIKKTVNHLTKKEKAQNIFIVKKYVQIIKIHLIEDCRQLVLTYKKKKHILYDTKKTTKQIICSRAIYYYFLLISTEKKKKNHEKMLMYVLFFIFLILNIHSDVGNFYNKYIASRLRSDNTHKKKNMFVA